MKKLLADRLYDTIRAVSPDMPEATIWKLVAAIISAIAAEQGVDLT
jgi:hypothetical protein